MPYLNERIWGLENIMRKMLMIGDIDSEKCHATSLQFLLLADGLSHHVQQLDLIIPKRDPKKDFIHFRNKNLNIQRKFGLRRFGFFRFFFRSPWIALYAARKKFDIIYISLSEKSSDVFLIFLLKLCSRAHLVCQFDPRIALSRKSTKTPLKKAYFRVGCLADSIHTTTQPLKKRLESHAIPGKKIFCIGNGTNTLKIYPLQQAVAFKKFNLDPHYIYIGYAGHLEHAQGLECLLHALSILKKTLPFIKIIIAGDGEKSDRLKFIAESLHLSEEVFFLGEIAFKKINLLLNTFDIAIAPSTDQYHTNIGSSPIKIRDYAAAGLPVIADEHHDIKNENEEIPWLISSKTNDPQVLAHTISDLIEKTNLRKIMQIAARRYAENHFSWKKISKQILIEINCRMNIIVNDIQIEKKSIPDSVDFIDL